MQFYCDQPESLAVQKRLLQSMHPYSVSCPVASGKWYVADMTGMLEALITSPLYSTLLPTNLQTKGPGLYELVTGCALQTCT